MAKFLCHATVHTNFLGKKTLKEKKMLNSLIVVDGDGP